MSCLVMQILRGQPSHLSSRKVCKLSLNLRCGKQLTSEHSIAWQQHSVPSRHSMGQTQLNQGQPKQPQSLSPAPVSSQSVPGLNLATLLLHREENLAEPLWKTTIPMGPQGIPLVHLTPCNYCTMYWRALLAGWCCMKYTQGCGSCWMRKGAGQSF